MEPQSTKNKKMRANNLLNHFFLSLAMNYMKVTTKVLVYYNPHGILDVGAVGEQSL